MRRKVKDRATIMENQRKETLMADNARKGTVVRKASGFNNMKKEPNEFKEFKQRMMVHYTKLLLEMKQ